MLVEPFWHAGWCMAAWVGHLGLGTAAGLVGLGFGRRAVLQHKRAAEQPSSSSLAPSALVAGLACQAYIHHLAARVI